MKIGVISDTHDHFDPRIHDHFAGVNHILHAGDVGKPVIILELEQIAPVTVVMGNNDDAAFGWRETEFVQLGGVKFLLHHIVAPGHLSEAMKSRVSHHEPDVVIYGHSHRQHDETRNGIRFFNPGYAGRPRFNQPRSLAILALDGTKISSKVMRLD